MVETKGMSQLGIRLGRIDEGYVRPKTPAPIIRIESNCVGSWFMEGEGEAISHIEEVMESR